MEKLALDAIAICWMVRVEASMGSSIKDIDRLTDDYNVIKGRLDKLTADVARGHSAEDDVGHNEPPLAIDFMPPIDLLSEKQAANEFSGSFAQSPTPSPTSRGRAHSTSSRASLKHEGGAVTPGRSVVGPEGFATQEQHSELRAVIRTLRDTVQAQRTEVYEAQLFLTAQGERIDSLERAAPIQCSDPPPAGICPSRQGSRTRPGSVPSERGTAAHVVPESNQPASRGVIGGEPVLHAPQSPLELHLSAEEPEESLRSRICALEALACSVPGQIQALRDALQSDGYELAMREATTVAKAEVRQYAETFNIDAQATIASFGERLAQISEQVQSSLLKDVSSYRRSRPSTAVCATPNPSTPVRSSSRTSQAMPPSSLAENLLELGRVQPARLMAGCSSRINTPDGLVQTGTIQAGCSSRISTDDGAGAGPLQSLPAVDGCSSRIDTPDGLDCALLAGPGLECALPGNAAPSAGTPTAFQPSPLPHAPLLGRQCGGRPPECRRPQSGRNTPGERARAAAARSLDARNRR